MNSYDIAIKDRIIFYSIYNGDYSIKCTPLENGLWQVEHYNSSGIIYCTETVNEHKLQEIL